MRKFAEIKEFVKLMGELISNDLKSRYSGSVLGIVWAYVQPLVTVLVFWYVFQVGFRNPPVENIEYILWFIAGYIPWTFFNDGVMSATNALYEYSYLVKKMKFRVWTLPIIKIFSSLYVHVFFMVFVIGMYLLYGHAVLLSWFSIIYYSFCLLLLLIGIAFLVSSLAVFFKDASQLVNVMLQIGFWLTPVFWSETSMNEGALRVLKYNPLYYIIQGYRTALIGGVNFWQRPFGETAYYWAATVIFMLIGMKVYRKLNPHFADLL